MTSILFVDELESLDHFFVIERLESDRLPRYDFLSLFFDEFLLTFLSFSLSYFLSVSFLYFSE